MRNPSCLPACQAATTDYWPRALLVSRLCPQFHQHILGLYNYSGSPFGCSKRL